MCRLFCDDVIEFNELRININSIGIKYIYNLISSIVYITYVVGCDIYIYPCWKWWQNLAWKLEMLRLHTYWSNLGRFPNLRHMNQRNMLPDPTNGTYLNFINHYFINCCLFPIHLFMLFNFSLVSMKRRNA